MGNEGWYMFLAFSFLLKEATMFGACSQLSALLKKETGRSTQAVKNHSPK
jgi:hypothetical protein